NGFEEIPTSQGPLTITGASTGVFTAAVATPEPKFMGFMLFGLAAVSVAFRQKPPLPVFPHMWKSRFARYRPGPHRIFMRWRKPPTSLMLRCVYVRGGAQLSNTISIFATAGLLAFCWTGSEALADPVITCTAGVASVPVLDPSSSIGAVGNLTLDC